MKNLANISISKTVIAVTIAWLSSCFAICVAAQAQNLDDILSPKKRDKQIHQNFSLGGNNSSTIRSFLEESNRKQQAKDASRRAAEKERTRQFEVFILDALWKYTQAVSQGTYHSQYKSSPGYAPPNFSTIWQSTFGNINFLEGTYGNNGDLIQLNVPVWSDAEQAYEAIGMYRKSGDSKTSGGVRFVFRNACSFTGYYGRNLDELAYAWNGQCTDQNAQQQAALNQQRQQQELQEAQQLQRQQQQQEAERVNAQSKPRLFGQWTSTYGDIHWEQNWYGERNNIIIMQEPYWDQSRNAWVARGNYGKKNSSSQGNLEFVFNGGCSFAGSWWPQGSDKRTLWTGNCKTNSSNQVASNNGSLNYDTRPKQDNGSLNYDTRPTPPNLGVLWSSTYGDINWGGGWYGEVNNFLSIGSPQWDPSFNGHVTEGYWGRRDGQQNVGGVRFVFKGPCSFIGSWWYHNTPEKKNQWTGSCK